MVEVKAVWNGWSCMQNRIRVAWFASAFVGRSASGTAQIARKIVEYVLLNESKSINLFLIVKNDYEISLINNDKILSRASLILLPKVKGKFLKSARQFYKYILTNKAEEIDILHFSVPRLYPFYWKFPAKKFFCTFHAGGDFSVPTDKFVTSRIIYNFIAKLQWKHLDKIFAVSDFGKSEIEIFYRVPKSRIDIIYPGTDHLWDLKSKKIAVDKSRCTIVIVGRWQKYKNVHSVLTALCHLEDSLLKNFHVVLVGKHNSTNRPQIEQLVRQLPPGNLTLYSYLSDAELKYLYENAQLVIHPSINEGFGLPAFEAFAEGAPIAVHQGVPADSHLSNHPQVYVRNMLSLESIELLLRNYKMFTRVDAAERRKYLINNYMTWNQMCKHYVRTYLGK